MSSDYLLPRLLGELHTSEIDPAEAAESQDQIDQFYRRLDATDQQIMTLRLDGCTTAEIADQLGMNHATVRVRLVRLRARLDSRGVLHEWL